MLHLPFFLEGELACRSCFCRGRPGLPDLPAPASGCRALGFLLGDGSLFRRFVVAFPSGVVGVGAGEFADLAASAEDEQMVGDFIDEVAVMRNHDHAPLERLQVLFQYAERHDVQIVRRLVEDQEIGTLHQDRAEV